MPFELVLQIAPFWLYLLVFLICNSVISMQNPWVFEVDKKSSNVKSSHCELDWTMCYTVSDFNISSLFFLRHCCIIGISLWKMVFKPFITQIMRKLCLNYDMQLFVYGWSGMLRCSTFVLCLILSCHRIQDSACSSQQEEH